VSSDIANPGPDWFSGIRSRKVAWFLESRGLSNVINLRGGLDAWARELDYLLAIY
jgi:rhodanese-related sulfurtransferase